MSTENTTLQDFTSSNDTTKSSTEEKENQADPSSQDDQGDETLFAESICPCYTENIKKCRDRLDENLIQKLNIKETGCGYCVDYISENVGSTIAESTAEAYSSHFRLYVEFLHKDETTVVEADFSQLMGHFNRLARLNRSESTISSHRSAITNLYKHISLYTDAEPNINWGLIREEINPSNFRTPEPREREPLEKSELKKLYDALDSFRNRLMVQVAVELGPRNVDLRSIKIDDVDFENKEIELSNKKAGGTYTAPVTDQLLLLLRRWVDEERPAHPKAETTDCLFPSEDGGMLSGDRFCDIVKNAAEQAGIQRKHQSEAPLTEREKDVLGTDKEYKDHHKVTPHALRHTFNHLLDEAGIPREYRSNALDHSSEEVTKEFYDHKDSNYKELLRELFSTKNSLLEG